VRDDPDTDVEAWQRDFASGDLEAFERLFRRHQRDVHGWVLKMLRDPATAEEVTVEAFWRAWKSRSRYDPARPFATWVRRIATNQAIDHLRQARPTVELPASFPAPDAGDAALTAEVRGHIVEAFESLPAKLRAAATLALIEGHGHAEIAEALGTSVGAVKVRVFRAVRRLRARLREKGIHA
jgi:RNA polymerase sigma-70 factor (ECF subfamily)